MAGRVASTVKMCQMYVTMLFPVHAGKLST
jgi:hypothetical protein